MTPEAEQLVTDHLYLARAMANKRNRHIPDLWRGDIESAAIEGLMKAAQAFDSSRGFKFSTYAAWRINGEMTDQLRQMHTGRPTANGNNWGNHGAVQSLEALAAQQSVNNRKAMPVSELDCVADLTSDPSRLVEHDVEQRLVHLLAERLHEDDQRLVDLYFMQDLTLAQIGTLLGVTESRISQRMTALKGRLRALAVRTELAAA